MAKISSRDIWIILAGYLAAMHVGKLSAVIPILQQDMGLSFTQAGFSLSLVQAAGMLFALSIGAFAEKLGLKRCLTFALLILGFSSIAGLWIENSWSLFIFRFLEGIGFLTISICAPAILKGISSPDNLNFKMGLWSSYMGVGVSLAILSIPQLLQWLNWQQIWVMLGMLCIFIAGMIHLFLDSADPVRQTASLPQQYTASSFLEIVKITLTHPPVICLALIFACYTSQWITLTGFLPSLYVQQGMDLQLAGLLVSLVVLANLGGTFGAGILLQRGYQPQQLLRIGFISMIICSAIVLTAPAWLRFELQYLSALLFSLIGGLIPTTVFAITMKYAPQSNAAAASMGLVLQVSACGQFLVPPATAALVTATQHWPYAVLVTLCLSLIGLCISYYLFHKAVHLKKEPI